MSTVLFVCVQNAGRSQMSQALLERAAEGRHRARSAGTRPADRVHPVVVEVMRELDIDLRGRTPQRLTQELAEQADVVVTMGCGDQCPVIPGKRYLDWELRDPHGQPVEVVREVRDEIAARVDELIRDSTCAADRRRRLTARPSSNPWRLRENTARIQRVIRFDKRDGLIVHEQEPFNAETDRGSLISPVTATDAFYVRGHGAVPELDPDTWRLRVEGLVQRELSLSLETLREAFVQRTLTATLQCAGNRRAGLVAVRDIPGEAPWGPGATGTASWTGAALADVLALAGPREEAAHVGFEGADLSPEAKPPQLFGGSVPLDKARRPEVLLAWEMNGRPLPAVHGAPIRVVVPGYIGARSVKWLTRIELRAAPWPGYFQDVVYRLLAPEQTVGPGVGMPLGLVALNSDVLAPQDGARVPAGEVEVRGYAFAGGDRHVTRVDVSTDEGRSWTQAELLDDLGRWAWRHWRIMLALSPGEHRIMVRAWDSSAATQPEDEAALWNPKGYVNNARPRISVTAVAG